MAGPDRHVPKYRHYRPKDLAVVRIDGRDHYLGKYDSPESWEKYYRLLAEHAIKGSVTPTVKEASQPGSVAQTINELILVYWNHARGYYVKDGEPTTEVGMIKLAVRPLHQLYGETAAQDFGPLALKAVRQEFIKGDLCRNEVNRRVRLILRMFKWAVSNEMVPPSVHEGLKVSPDATGRGFPETRRLPAT